MVNGGYAIADLSFVTSEQWFSIEDGTKVTISKEQAKQIFGVCKSNKILFYAMINDITGEGIEYDVIRDLSYMKDDSVEIATFTIHRGAADFSLSVQIYSDVASIFKQVDEGD